MSDPNDPFAALDRSVADTVKRAQLETEIYTRVRALMREHGLNYGYGEDDALEQAKLEVLRGVAK